jgi:anti-sigma-K factor RskA
VSTSFDTNDHPRADALLDDYVMGTLTAQDQQWMDAHVATCDICQQELPDLLDAMQALPFGAPEPPFAMNDDVWKRIETSITASGESTPPSPAPVVEMRRPPSNMSLLSARWRLVAAVFLVLIVGGVVIAQVIQSIGGDDSQTIKFAFTDPDISANGKLAYYPDEKKFVFSSSDMPELSEGQVYQAWLIQGDEPPVPGGVMDPSTGKVEISGDRNAFDTFALTVEPGPSGGAAPTSKPIVTAPLREGESKNM